jgi:hypothetical protein
VTVGADEPGPANPVGGLLTLIAELEPSLSEDAVLAGAGGGEAGRPAAHRGRRDGPA